MGSGTLNTSQFEECLPPPQKEQLFIMSPESIRCTRSVGRGQTKRTGLFEASRRGGECLPDWNCAWAGKARGRLTERILDWEFSAFSAFFTAAVPALEIQMREFCQAAKPFSDASSGRGPATLTRARKALLECDAFLRGKVRSE